MIFILKSFITNFHHRLVFRIAIFIYKIINFSSAPSQLNKLLKPSTLENNRYDFRSNQAILFLADHSCLRFGDITFKNTFSSYLKNIMELIFKRNFIIKYYFR